MRTAEPTVIEAGATLLGISACWGVCAESGCRSAVDEPTTKSFWDAVVCKATTVVDEPLPTVMEDPGARV